MIVPSCATVARTINAKMFSKAKSFMWMWYFVTDLHGNQTLIRHPLCYLS